MHIKFLWVGKTKNSAIRSLVADYQQRIQRLVPCEVIEARDVSKGRSIRPAEAMAAEAQELARHLPESGRLTALEETGTQFTSPGFARWLQSEQNTGARVITFVIGGPDGLDPVISKRAHLVFRRVPSVRLQLKPSDGYALRYFSITAPRQWNKRSSCIEIEVCLITGAVPPLLKDGSLS